MVISIRFPTTIFTRCSYITMQVRSLPQKRWRPNSQKSISVRSESSSQMCEYAANNNNNIWFSSLILIAADRCRDTGTDQWICCWLPSRAGAQDLLKVPGRATVCIPVPQAVSHWAAIHCCHFAWQFSTKLGPRATNGIAFNPREPRYIEYSNDKAETNLRGGPESKPLLNYHYIALKWRLSG